MPFRFVVTRVPLESLALACYPRPGRRKTSHGVGATHSSGSVSRRRGDCRAARPHLAHGRRARLSRRRHRHRPLCARPALRADRRRRGAAFRRVRRGDAAVRDRARASPGQALGHALGDLRARHCAAGRHLAGAGRDRHGAWAHPGTSLVHRPCPVAVIDRVRAASARGERRAHHAARQARLRRAAVPGPCGDPAHRSGAAVRAWRRRADHGCEERRHCHRHHSRRDRGGALPVEPALSHRRRHRRARGDDGDRAADRGRRGAGHGGGRAIGGARIVHRRRAAGRTPNIAIRSRPTSRRSRGCCLPCSSSRSACRSISAC